MTFPSEIRQRLETFIEVKCVDSIASHLRHIFLFQHEGKICGAFNRSQISIWVSDTRTIGVFYPIIQLKYNAPQKKVLLKAKMNGFGFCLALLINAALLWLGISLFFLREGLNANSILQRILGFIIFLIIFNSPIYLTYRPARNMIIKEIEDRLKTNSR